LQNFGEFKPFRVPARLITTQYAISIGWREFPVRRSLGISARETANSLEATSVQVHASTLNIRTFCAIRKDMVARTLKCSVPGRVIARHEIPAAQNAIGTAAPKQGPLFRKTNYRPIPANVKTQPSASGRKPQSSRIEVAAHVQCGVTRSGLVCSSSLATPAVTLLADAGLSGANAASAWAN